MTVTLTSILLASAAASTAGDSINLSGPDGGPDTLFETSPMAPKSPGLWPDLRHWGLFLESGAAATKPAEKPDIELKIMPEARGGPGASSDLKPWPPTHVQDRTSAPETAVSVMRFAGAASWVSYRVPGAPHRQTISFKPEPSGQ